jgi:HAD superfamily hydrolase (TIGR01509 family)
MSARAIGGVSSQPQHARVWLFDFDNTIAHLEREVDWAAGRRELEAFLRVAGVAAPIFAEIPKGNLPLYETLRGRLADSASAASLAENGKPRASWGANGEQLLRDASSIVERYELAGVDRAEPTPGALELLKAIAASGKTIAIVTSNSSRTIERWLNRHHMSALIHTIVGRDTLLALKPSPAMVFEALRRCNARPQDALFIGDSTADLGATRAAGIHFYGIATNAARYDHLAAAGAMQIFASPAALRSYLDLPVLAGRA